ncbi:MAG: hypothetical protein K2O62_01240, partial [Clostridia bacterium]|nr:hypothetical protein [Clostridia bacterium]
MLKVLAFYLILWWFTKLENKKWLIVRAVIASVLAILFLISAIFVFTEPHMAKDGFAFMGIFGLVPAILFGLRAICDIRKLCTILKKPENKSVSKTKTQAK